MADNNAFQEWAIVELFGRQRIAGRVSEQTVGGCAFVRIDVPGDDKEPGFTKLLGQGSIYAITITDETTARAVAAFTKPEPMEKWSVADMLRQRSLPDYQEVEEESL